MPSTCCTYYRSPTATFNNAVMKKTHDIQASIRGSLSISTRYTALRWIMLSDPIKNLNMAIGARTVKENT
ncbi:hypothetical protein PI124_g18433 [Phytophthora idaei]|nr:hypothetical protein PI125_g19101 [Phytophthora idaei]KAG3236558.1 hypothetical protein PI124_g18433 [Phytophthora idaei]